MYQCILADPPWEFDAPLAMADGVVRSSKSQYDTMTVQGVCDLYEPDRVVMSTGTSGSSRLMTSHRGTLAGHQIADIAVVGLWVPAAFLLDGVHIRVCNAWGFTPKQIVPWIKGRISHDGFDTTTGRCRPDGVRLVIQPGMGALTRVCVEYLVLATRGKYTSLVKNHAVNGLLIAPEEAFIVAPKSKHSRKPVGAYAMMEKLLDGPRLELFARETRDSWDGWGHEYPSPPDIIDPPYFAETWPS